ncbi:MAG: tRNA pseudouridine(13) synthase TruD, partial [Planctomycetota bacterium]
PGTGGQLRRRREDFQVEEVPLYPPCGEGEHVYFRVFKEGISTFEAVRRIAEALEVPEREVAYAGLKDARAVTSQWMSVQGVDEERVRALEVRGLAVGEVARHGNKLRVGHLRGNRFKIRVRGAAAGAAPRAHAILDLLVRRGAPNYFGEQRFGIRADSWACGEAIVRRDHDAFVKRLLGGPSNHERDPRLREARKAFEEGKLEEAYAAMPTRLRSEKKALHALIRFGDPERAYFSIPMRMRQMFVSAFQSYLFNKVLERRVAGLDRVEEGDLAYLHRNGAVFPVTDAPLEQPRCLAFEISPSGPLFGTTAPLAGGAPGGMEREVLAEFGLSAGDFEVGGGLRVAGMRRALRIPLKEVSIEEEGGSDYRVEFLLPPGAFATVVMAELMQNPEETVADGP